MDEIASAATATAAARRVDERRRRARARRGGYVGELASGFLGFEVDVFFGCPAPGDGVGDVLLGVEVACAAAADSVVGLVHGGLCCHGGWPRDRFTSFGIDGRVSASWHYGRQMSRTGSIGSRWGRVAGALATVALKIGTCSS